MRLRTVKGIFPGYQLVVLGVQDLNPWFQCLQSSCSTTTLLFCKGGSQKEQCEPAQSPQCTRCGGRRVEAAPFPPSSGPAWVLNGENHTPSWDGGGGPREPGPSPVTAPSAAASPYRQHTQPVAQGQQALPSRRSGRRPASTGRVPGQCLPESMAWPDEMRTHLAILATKLPGTTAPRQHSLYCPSQTPPGTGLNSNSIFRMPIRQPVGLSGAWNQVPRQESP